MYLDTFKYPSKWTESWDAYNLYRPDLCKEIIQHMDNYRTRIPQIRKQKDILNEQFFSAGDLLNNIKQ